MKYLKYILLLTLFILFSCVNDVNFKGGKTYKVNNKTVKDSSAQNSEIDSIFSKTDSTFKIGPIIKDTITIH